MSVDQKDCWETRLKWWFSSGCPENIINTGYRFKVRDQPKMNLSYQLQRQINKLTNVLMIKKNAEIIGMIAFYII